MKQPNPHSKLAPVAALLDGSSADAGCVQPTAYLLGEVWAGVRVSGLGCARIHRARTRGLVGGRWAGARARACVVRHQPSYAVVVHGVPIHAARRPRGAPRPACVVPPVDVSPIDVARVPTCDRVDDLFAIVCGEEVERMCALGAVRVLGAAARREDESGLGLGRGSLPLRPCKIMSEIVR